MPWYGDFCFHGLEPAVGLYLGLWTVDHSTSTTCHYLPGFCTSTEFTAWWQSHVGVNNLPKVITQYHNRWGLNSWFWVASSSRDFELQVRFYPFVIYYVCYSLHDFILIHFWLHWIAYIMLMCCWETAHALTCATSMPYHDFSVDKFQKYYLPVCYWHLKCGHMSFRVVDSLQECCHCNEMSVVITSVELVNDLLTSLEQLVTSDVPILNIDPSPSYATLLDAVNGISSSASTCWSCLNAVKL